MSQRLYSQAPVGVPEEQEEEARAAESADLHAWQHMTRTVAHYERLEQIGEGTYGQVYRARCIDSGRIVALKKMRIHHGGYWGMPLQLIREIKILKRLRHPNLLQMIEVVTSKGVEYLDNDDPPSKNHQVKDKVADARESYKGNLFLVLEYIEHDLTGLLDVAYQFTPVQIKCIFKQLLEALAFMHQNKYVHRDIKSSNLLLDSNFTLKLADFGLARSIEAPLLDQVQERKASYMSGPEFTNKVITLWYRPPEILLGAVQYGPAVDVWSAGCILAELILGKPLFAAKTELDQLQLILEMLGSPPSSETYDFFESGMKKDTTKVPLSLTRSHKPPGKLRPKYSQKMPPAALGLLEKMLAWDPRQRVTAANALSHRYFWTDPVAPANPAQLGETLRVGGPGGHFHEFQTKKKRKQAKAMADEAKEKARHKGATEEQAQEVHDKTYRSQMKKVCEEGLGASEENAVVDPSRRGDRRRRSTSPGRRSEEGESRRRDNRSAGDRYDEDDSRRKTRESRRRDAESGKKRRRDDPEDGRRSRRSRDRRSRDEGDLEDRYRGEEPRVAEMMDESFRGEDPEMDRGVPGDRSPSGSVERMTREGLGGQDLREGSRPDDIPFPEDPEYRPRHADRERFREPDDRDRGVPPDRPPFDDRGPPDGRDGRDRPLDRHPFDDRGPPPGRGRDRPPFDDRRPPFDGRGPPNGRGKERPMDRPPIDGRGPPDGRGGRDGPMGRPPFDARSALDGRGGRDRPPFEDRGPPEGGTPFDDRGPPVGRAARGRPPLNDRGSPGGDRPPNRPPFDDRGPPGRDRPPFDDRGPSGRDRPMERPPFDDRGPPGRDRPMERPPFDDRGPPGRDRPMERPPFGDRGPPGKDRPMERPPFDDRGPPGRDRPMERPPFDDRGPPGGRGGRNRPPIDDRGMPRHGPPFDGRDRPPGRPPFDGRDRPRDMSPLEWEGPPMDERRRMRDRGPEDPRDILDGEMRPDDRDRRRMGPPPHQRDRHRDRGFPGDRGRPGDGPMEDDFDRSRRHPDRGRYRPNLDEEDPGLRNDADMPNGDSDRPAFPNEPLRPDEPERRPDRPDGGDRRDRSHHRDSHRHRKKDKKRRHRSRSRGRHDDSRRRDRNRDDRRRDDGNPDYYGPDGEPQGQEEGDRRERHRDRDRP